MIRVFEATGKSFTSNGDMVILPTKAKVTKKIVKMDERGTVTVQYETGAI